MKQEPPGHQQKAERPQLQAAKLLYTFKWEPGQYVKEALQPMPTPPGLHPRHEDVRLTNTRK